MGVSGVFHGACAKDVAVDVDQGAGGVALDFDGARTNDASADLGLDGFGRGTGGQEHG